LKNKLTMQTFEADCWNLHRSAFSFELLRNNKETEGGDDG
jgi:hypothetical protein